MEQAVLWLAEKAAKGGGRKVARGKKGTKAAAGTTAKSVVKKVRRKSAKK
jgi:hypothetical protein